MKILNAGEEEKILNTETNKKQKKKKNRKVETSEIQNLKGK